MRRAAILLALSVAALAMVRGVRAQSDAKPLVFEVASVKSDRSGAMARNINMRGDRFEAVNVPLVMLVAFAYGESGPPPRPLSNDRIVAGPTWMNTDAFDVTAKAHSEGSATASPEQKQFMMRALLSDRFRLVVHHESRPTAMYRLVLARSDGRLGSRLERASLDANR
jgi:uncharacterized protein (TIGR03435 family)